MDLMEVLDNETQNQSGEDDVTRSLIALNAAQDYFESLVALQPKVLGGVTGTVTTTVNVETTAFPSGVLRIDKLQMLDAATGRPVWTLDPIRSTGGHVWARSWPLNITSPSTVTGKPRAYWTNGTNIYWDPLPDATHTVRYYGFATAAAITAGGTFLYPDICQLPFASFASKLMQMGIGDDTNELTNMAAATFAPTIAALSAFNRDGAVPFEYRYGHDV